MDPQEGGAHQLTSWLIVQRQMVTTDIIIQLVLHGLNRLNLGIHMHTMTINEKRSLEFERELESVYRRVWREERERGKNKLWFKIIQTNML